MNVKKIKTTITPVQDQTDKLLDMQKTIEAYKQSGREMGQEILALKRSINSYKGENTKLRNRIKELQELEVALCDKNRKLRTERNELEAKYNELQGVKEKLDNFLALPWYKKIFVK